MLGGGSKAMRRKIHQFWQSFKHLLLHKVTPEEPEALEEVPTSFPSRAILLFLSWLSFKQEKPGQADVR